MLQTSAFNDSFTKLSHQEQQSDQLKIIDFRRRGALRELFDD
jgi:hypothetical protein